MCERRAVAAERGAMDRYVAAYMAAHVGATFPGRVTSVTRFGLFVALDGTGADGLIPIRSLGQEFFRHDEGRQMLVGERTGESFGLGDRCRLKLVEADTATGGLLFDMVEVIERVERHGRAARPKRPCRERAGRVVRSRIAGRSGQTVATTPLRPAPILSACHRPRRPRRFLDRDAPRLARSLPALRRRPAVRRLPQDAQPSARPAGWCSIPIAPTTRRPISRFSQSAISLSRWSWYWSATATSRRCGFMPCCGCRCRS